MVMSEGYFFVNSQLKYKIMYIHHANISVKCIPRTHHFKFYIIKMGFTRVHTLFPIFCSKT